MATRQFNVHYSMNLDRRVGQVNRMEVAHGNIGDGQEGTPGKQGALCTKSKATPERPHPKVPERHLVGDEVLKKIIQRVLAELKLPGKIPSEVIFAALAEVRDLVEQATERR